MKKRKSIRLLARAQKILYRIQDIIEDEKNPKSQFSKQDMETRRELFAAMDKIRAFIANID